MARLTALLLILSLVSGCSAFSRRHRGAAAAADVAAVAGALLVVANVDCHEPATPRTLENPLGWDSESECFEEDRAVAGGTVLLGVAAVVGLAVLLSQPAADPPEDATP